jgi:hypothetical protein
MISQINTRLSKVTPIVWPLMQRDHSSGKRSERLSK